MFATVRALRLSPAALPISRITLEKDYGYFSLKSDVYLSLSS